MKYIIESLNSNECDEFSGKVSLWKSVIFVGFILLFFLLLISRLVNLSVQEYKTYLLKASNNFLSKKYIVPDRGIIYSSNMVPLVENLPVFSIVIDLNTLDRFKIYKSIYDVLPQNVVAFLLDNKILFDAGNLAEINSGLVLGKEFIELKNFYDEKEYSALKSKLKEVDTGKVKIIEGSYRKYKNGFEYSNVLGYVSAVSSDDIEKDLWYSPDQKIGVLGLENVYEKELRGQKGETTLMYNSKYSVYSSKTTKEATPGKSLVSTINNDLQVVAYASLKKQIEKVKATAGAVVAQDPNTGEILAITSYPSFDINEFSKGISSSNYTNLLNDPSKPLIDRTVSSAFPPGSVFKVITATAGLSEKSLDKDTSIIDKGVINIGNFAYKTWKAGGHGVINIIDALKESSDIFFYVLGGGHADYPQIKALGPWKLYKWSKLFNFGNTLGIDLPNEVSGFVADPDWKQKTYNENWYVGNSYHFAIGQGFVTATPLQINTMISAIANGGKIYKPFVVKEIIDSKTLKVIKTIEPVEISNLNIAKEDLATIKEGLIKASSPGGTAYPLFNYKVSVAGKTGTAEFGPIKKDGTYPTHAWYTAFAPADNPKIAVTVFLEDGGGGSDNAAPVVKDIFDEWFR